MSQPFLLYRRSNGIFYLEDAATGKQTSLRTKSKSVAVQRLTAKTQAAEQPYLNLTMARAYLSAKSPEMLSRTWSEIMDDMAIGYKGSTRQRWVKVVGASITNVFSCGRCRVTLLNTGLVKTYMGLPGQNG